MTLIRISPTLKAMSRTGVLNSRSTLGIKSLHGPQFTLKSTVKENEQMDQISHQIRIYTPLSLSLIDKAFFFNHP